MDGVIKVNVVNFITVGLMALVFVFAVRLALTRFWPNAAGMLFGSQPQPSTANS